MNFHSQFDYNNFCKYTEEYKICYSDLNKIQILFVQNNYQMLYNLE